MFLLPEELISLMSITEQIYSADEVIKNTISILTANQGQFSRQSESPSWFAHNPMLITLSYLASLSCVVVKTLFCTTRDICQELINLDLQWVIGGFLYASTVHTFKNSLHCLVFTIIHHVFSSLILETSSNSCSMLSLVITCYSVFLIIPRILAASSPCPDMPPLCYQIPWMQVTHVLMPIQWRTNIDRSLKSDSECYMSWNWTTKPYAFLWFTTQSFLFVSQFWHHSFTDANAANTNVHTDHKMETGNNSAEGKNSWTEPFSRIQPDNTACFLLELESCSGQCAPQQIKLNSLASICITKKKTLVEKWRFSTWPTIVTNGKILQLIWTALFQGYSQWSSSHASCYGEFIMLQ